MKNLKKSLALLLTVAMLLSVVAGAIPAFADSIVVTTLTGHSFHSEGLWLTEIYPNDVDRSTEKDTRADDGCYTVTTYDNTSDHMEFIELISTHEEDFQFNDVYMLYYNTKQLTVTNINGGSDITVKKGQPIVIWNERLDVTGTRPDAATFIKEMHIPDNALVIKTSGGGWDPAATFSLKLKSTGATFCSFKPTSDVDVKDGLSVELQMPFWKSETTMEIYHKQNIPSPGYVYHDQVRGYITAIVPEDYDGGVFITEMRPDDIERKGTYGTASDYFECLEITNSTSKTVTLNKDVELVYTYKESSRKALPIYQYSSSASNHVGSSSNCTIPAGGTAVIWCYRYQWLNADSTKFPTVTDLRNAYGIPSSVPVYIFANQNSMNDTYRGFELYTKNADGSLKLPVSSYFYKGGDEDLGDGKSVLLKARHDGPGMAVKTANAASTFGTVTADQTAYSKDYGTGFDIALLDGSVIPEYIMEDEPLHVAFQIDYDKRMPRANIVGAHRTMYRFDGKGDWIYCTEGGYRLDGKDDYQTKVRTMLEIMVPAHEVFGHEYIEFYTMSTNNYRSTVTGIYRVDIKKVNDVDGIRTNIDNNQFVKGTVAITANDGTTNANTSIYIDGTKQTTSRMLEDGAYLSFYTGKDTRHSQFYDALTTTDNKMVANISEWHYLVPDAQMHHIDNSYFTYSGGKFTVTLRLWSGNMVTFAEDHLTPDANRDDFDVSQIQMRLPNGKSYLPTKIGPSTYNGVDTSAKTNLSTALDAVHQIGDSNKMCPYMDMTFSIPEADSTAVGVKLDTTKLSDGKHTLKVTNGTSTKTVTFYVDNTAPVVDMDIEGWEQVPGYITIDPKISDANGLKNLTVKLDGQLIDLPYETTAHELGTDTHNLTIMVEDPAGNTTTQSQNFYAGDVSVNVSSGGTEAVTHNAAKLYLTAQSSSATEATFYQAKKIETAAIHATTAGGILPHINYVLDVGQVDEDDEIVINWNGAVSGADNTHATTMFVRNIRSGAWDKVAVADANGSILNASFSVKDHVEGGTANIIVQCTADSALPTLDTTTDGIKGNNANWDGTDRPDDYDFSFAWITDTQYYSEKWPYHYDNIATWISNNIDEWKIKYLMHTGDITDNYDMPWEWERASQSQEILDASGLPYGVLAGNHDVAGAQNVTNLYWQYFGDHRFENQPTFGGSYKNNLGHYDLISEHGQDFIIVYMSWNVYQEEIDWMNQVLAQYSDRKAILCFHGYLHVQEEMDGLLDNFGVLIRDQVVAKNPNVFAVLNGHYFGASYQTVRFDDNRDGKLDRTVYQICTDYQSAWEGGEEYIKFFYFDLDNDQVYVNSYSPYFNDFNYYDNSVRDLTALANSASNGVKWEVDMDTYKFSLDFDTNKKSILENSFSAYLATNEVLGTAPVDEATGTVTLRVEGLNAGSDYAWYAELNNAESGYLRTDMYDFTTEDQTEYYLFGYINGANYGCEEDYQNMGQYKFDENGSLTVMFRQDSYVAVKEMDNRNWYMAQQYCTDTETTLYNTNTGVGEKMFVPAYQKLTFKLVNNGDGTLNLSYTAAECDHEFNVVITNPTCTQSGNVVSTCQICGYKTEEVLEATGHNFVSGSCTNCGAVDGTVTPVTNTYYLVGWINNANYGCEEDYENNGIYKFVNGQLTAVFESDSYVFLKTEGNGKWLLADAYCTDTVCTLREGGTEKMWVPGGVQLFFNITENADGSVVLSYTRGSAAGCDHSYTAEVTTEATCTTAGLRTYTCSKCGHSYTQTIAPNGHNFFGGSCSVCGIADPNGSTTGMSYYLVGFINGADHGCEVDWQNLGDYKFVDGHLTATFTEDSYVFVKTGDNKDFLLAPSYCEASTCTFAVGNTEKMFVPGGVELTFVLTENADGSVSLTYTSGNTPASVIPTVTLKSPTLEFKDMITINAFYTAENTQDVVEMGMITYTSKVDRWSVRTADHVIPGAVYVESSGRYYSASQGIHAKYLADTFYLATYAKLADGSYVYSKLAPYSPVTYANSQLKNSTDVKLKQLVVAMLNYGAEAQLYFGHNTGNLANAALNAEHLALPESYRTDMVSTVPAAPAEKQGIFANNQGFSTRRPAVSFEGAFCINYFFTPKYAPVGNITLYYWTEADYNAAGVLTADNATGSIVMDGTGVGQYRGDIEGIAAKNLSQAVYVAGIYSDGTNTWTSGVLGYSIGAYCSSQASKGGDIAGLAMATAVYGYHAKAYFG